MSSSSSSNNRSPSSVRWPSASPYNHYYQKKGLMPPFGFDDAESDNDDEEHNHLSEAWDIPSRQEMSRRLQLRQRIREETLAHRRIHRHGGLKGRNIVYVLADRQTTSTQRQIPITCYSNTHNKSTNKTAAKNVSYSSSSGSSNKDDDAVVIPSEDKKKKHHRLLHSPTSIKDEIRVFAEYCSVLRYHSAFLSHLGGQDVVESMNLLQQQQRGGGTTDTNSGNAFSFNNNGNQNQANAGSSGSNSSSGAGQPPQQQQPSSANQQQQRRLPNSSQAISTISIAFSPDAQTMASTHGDHTVKITECASGYLLETLEGHPRTPWTVKYHPLNPDILASGCLGHQVRIWNWTTKQCLKMIRLEFAIISLSFHPTGQILAIANGTRLHFWSLANNINIHGNNNNNNNGGGGNNHNSLATTRSNQNQNSSSAGGSNNNTTSAGTTTSSSSSGGRNTGTGGANNNNNQNQNNSTSNTHHNVMTEVEQRHMLRCVHFPPNGNTIIVGGVNPPSSQEGQRGGSHGGGVSGGGMSFYLRLWDFDLQAALKPGEMTHMGLRRRAIGNPRTFVPRALLYNDGGFDVSPDGKTLCACAEYWLPDGVDSAMELLKRQQDDAYNEYHMDDEYSIRDEPQDDEAAEGDATGGNYDDADEVFLDDYEDNLKDNERGQQHDGDDSQEGDRPDDATPDPYHPQQQQHPQQDTIDSVATSSASTTPSSSQQQQLPSISPPRGQIAIPRRGSGGSGGSLGTTPQTPPPNAAGRNSLVLSPPSPPGRRFAGGLGQPSHNQNQQASSQGTSTRHPQQQQQQYRSAAGTSSVPAATAEDTAGSEDSRPAVQANPGSVGVGDGATSSNQPPPIAPPPPPGMNRPPNPFSNLNANTGNAPNPSGTSSSSASASYRYLGTNPVYMDPSSAAHGRYVPHVVTISMDTTPVVQDVVATTTTTNVRSPSGVMAGAQQQQQQQPGGGYHPAMPRHPGAPPPVPHHHPNNPNLNINTNLASRSGGSGSGGNSNSRQAAAMVAPRSNIPLRPRLGQLLEACPLDGAKASAVTCVKFSPSTNFCLIGYGVRETLVEHNGNQYHPVTALYKIKGGMTHVSTMLSGDDDVNIARFHPDSGYGFVYGTKQGRVRVLSPRPWNYYNC